MRRGEVAAALFRLLIFATLLAALGVEAALAGHVHPLTVIVLLYGAATIAGLVLALLGRVGPGVAYLFVTFDVATLVAVLLMISMMGRFPGRGLFALPLAGFVFVILIHAAIRYRPALVGYGAVLFVTAVLATEVAVQRAPAVFERLLAHPAAHGAIEMSPAAGTGRHAISLALVGLAATLLIYLVWRTRQLLQRAIPRSSASPGSPGSSRPRSRASSPRRRLPRVSTGIVSPRP